MEDNRPIWEQHGIPLEEFARAYNEELKKAFTEHLKDKIYFIDVKNPRNCMRICNIKIPEDLGKA